LLARQNSSVFTALACSHGVVAVLLSDVGSFLQRVAAFDCFPAECDKADQTFADDADDLLRFSINSSYYSLMGDFCQNALSSSASSAKAPQCSRAASSTGIASASGPSKPGRVERKLATLSEALCVVQPCIRQIQEQSCVEIILKAKVKSADVPSCCLAEFGRLGPASLPHQRQNFLYQFVEVGGTDTFPRSLHAVAMHSRAVIQSKPHGQDPAFPVVQRRHIESLEFARQVKLFIVSNRAWACLYLSKAVAVARSHATKSSGEFQKFLHASFNVLRTVSSVGWGHGRQPILIKPP
jgi:hypothetical protein